MLVQYIGDLDLSLKNFSWRVIPRQICLSDTRNFFDKKCFLGKSHILGYWKHCLDNKKTFPNLIIDPIGRNLWTTFNWNYLDKGKFVIQVVGKYSEFNDSLDENEYNFVLVTVSDISHFLNVDTKIDKNCSF